MLKSWLVLGNVGQNWVTNRNSLSIITNPNA